MSQSTSLTQALQPLKNLVWRRANRFTSFIPPPPYGGMKCEAQESCEYDARQSAGSRVSFHCGHLRTLVPNAFSRKRLRIRCIQGAPACRRRFSSCAQIRLAGRLAMPLLVLVDGLYGDVCGVPILPGKTSPAFIQGLWLALNGLCMQTLLLRALSPPAMRFGVSTYTRCQQKCQGVVSSRCFPPQSARATSLKTTSPSSTMYVCLCTMLQWIPAVLGPVQTIQNILATK
jgi:hypothetical protein